MNDNLKQLIEEIGLVDRLVQRIERLEEQLAIQADKIMHLENPQINGHKKILELWHNLERQEYECENYKECPLPDRPLFLDINPRFERSLDNNPKHKEIADLLDKYGAPDGYEYHHNKRNTNRIFGPTLCMQHKCGHTIVA